VALAGVFPESAVMSQLNNGQENNGQDTNGQDTNGQDTNGQDAALNGRPNGRSSGVRRWRVLVLAGVLAAAPIVTGFPQVSAQAKAHPVASQSHEVSFVGASVASMRAAKGATLTALSGPASPDPVTTARAGGVTPVQDVAGAVTVVGVTWPKGAISAGDQFQIRTLTGATWSQWQSFDVDEADGPDPAEAAAAATNGTSPYVVTGASKFEVRSLTTNPTAPTAAKVQVVDPGDSAADSAQPAPGSAAAAAAKPAVFSRASWGADERIRRAAPEYGQVQFGFVHHTDSSNTYTASQVPAMIRGIYAYHVKGQGWNDIGYNFLVDRFGRTWEGRFGGMDRAVIGAQTLNYNSWSMGVSAIGNFDTTAVPQVMTNAFKRIFAWKFSLSGIPATGTVFANNKYFQRVSGHRDGFATGCPGARLYAKLAEIRAGAAALIGTLPRSTISRDVDRNGAADALSYSPSTSGTSITGPTSLLASAPRPPVRGGVTIGIGWNSLRGASLSPDLTGDGKADVIVQDPAADRLRIHLGNGRGGFSGVLYRGPGWNAMTSVIAARDRNGDGFNDILATNAAGALIFYAGNGAGSFRTGRVIGSGWNTMRNLTTAGDLNGDRIPDLLATRTSDGVLMMYAGVAGGSVASGLAWGTRWGSFSAVVGGSDLDGDRYPDVFARLGDAMMTYSSGAGGRIVRSTAWGSGWQSLTQLSTGADWNGDGVADLLAVNPAGAGSMILYAGTGQGAAGNRLTAFQTRAAAIPAVPGADIARLVGDVNGDGYVDAVARVRTNGTLVLLLGQSSSRFAAPRSLGVGWNSFNLIEAAGDFDYDGVPDLLARDATGKMFLYPFQRSLTFKNRMSVGTGWAGLQSVVGVGAFNGDANGDVIALRRSDHALIFFRGNGPNVLQDSTVVAAAQNDITQLLGMGDGNGDGKADLMARATDGRVWLYPGNGVGGLGRRQLVLGGEGVGHVLG
jgi:N-acetylmuramoyl-L-alanine amidase/FG-GAP-like repeat